MGCGNHNKKAKFQPIEQEINQCRRVEGDKNENKFINLLKQNDEYIQWEEITKGNYISRGLQGNVFKGLWKEKKCALKQFHYYFQNSAITDQEFDGEIKKIFLEYDNNRYAQLNNIPRVSNVLGFSIIELDKGQGYNLVLVSELYGLDLKKLIDNTANARMHKNLSENQIRQVLEQLLDTFINCTEHAIIHRDIKLENILLCNINDINDFTENTELLLVVGDFSETSYKSGDSYILRSDQSITVKGTVNYMSPQMINGYLDFAGKIRCDGEKNDVFMLGITILQLIYFQMNRIRRNTNEEQDIIKICQKNKQFKKGLGPLKNEIQRLNVAIKKQYDSSQFIQNVLYLLEQMLQFHEKYRFNFKQALEYYKKYIKVVNIPQDSDTLETRPEIQENEDNFDQLMDSIAPKYTFQSYTESIDLYSQAYQAYGGNQMEKAIELLKEALTHDNLNPMFYELLGDIYVDLKQIELGQFNYQKSLELDPFNFDMIYKKAEQLYDTYKESEIHQQKKQIYQNQALDDLNRVVSLDPQHLQAVILRYKVNLELKNYKEAVEDLDLAINFKHSQHNLYFNRGNLKMNHLNKLEEAVKDYSKAIEIKNDVSAFYNNRSVAYQQLKQTALSVQDMEKVQQLQGESNLDSMLYFAQQYAQQNKMNEAVNQCTKALEKLPDNSEILLYRGQYYYKMKQYEQSSQDYSTIIQSEVYLNSEKDQFYTTARYKRGFINIYNLKKFPEAKEDFTQCILVKYQESQCYSMRGQVNKELKLYEAALQDFDKAIEIDSSNQIALNSRAVLKNNTLKDYQGALTDYLELLKLKPKDREIQQTIQVLKNNLNCARRQENPQVN